MHAHKLNNVNQYLSAFDHIKSVFIINEMVEKTCLVRLQRSCATRTNLITLWLLRSSVRWLSIIDDNQIVNYRLCSVLAHNITKHRELDIRYE